MPATYLGILLIGSSSLMLLVVLFVGGYAETATGDLLWLVGILLTAGVTLLVAGTNASKHDRSAD